MAKATDSEPEDSTPVPLPECKNGETIPYDDGLFRAFQVSLMEPLQAEPQGVNIRIRVRSSRTANQYTCVETALAPKTMVPSPHRHAHLDELSFVLQGTLSVMVEDEVYDIPAGGCTGARGGWCTHSGTQQTNRYAS